MLLREWPMLLREWPMLLREWPMRAANRIKSIQ
jgi:hypothetical protein